MGFRENLKNELVYSGMLVKELSAKTGIKKHTLDNYLSCKEGMPSAEVAVKIAQALGVSVEYLVTGEENTPARRILSPEVRLMARLADQLSPEYRKIALAIIEVLKKNEQDKP